MNIAWEDGNGNILNANNERIIYLDVGTDKKTTVKREEVKKITLEDGLMNIFEDFNSGLILTIVIPKKNKRDAIKVFNKYDKTGTMLKGKSSNFLLDLILESSVIIGNPLAGIIAIGLIILIPLNILMYFVRKRFGDIGLDVIRIIFFGYLGYTVISYILLRIQRKKLKESCL